MSYEARKSSKEVLVIRKSFSNFRAELNKELGSLILLSIRGKISF